MKHVLFLAMLLATAAHADQSAEFLNHLCLQGFSQTKMPNREAARFCACVTEDVTPRLTPIQRDVLANAKANLDGGRSVAVERFASSGVRELVVAGQARCEAAFYPPSAPIRLADRGLQLTLRCDPERNGPEAFVYLRGAALLSKQELRSMDERMMKGDFRPEYAKVTLQFDGKSQSHERWEIDVTGEMVSSPNPDALVSRLRESSVVALRIERGAQVREASLVVAGAVPTRWVACPAKR